MNYSNSILLTSNTSWYLYNFREGTIRAFIDDGYKVYCVAPYDEYSAKLEAFGVVFIPLNVIGKSVNPFNELRSILSIFKTLRTTSPDVVFNFTIKMNIYFGICCQILKIPYVNNVSGLGTAFLHNNLIYRLSRKLYEMTNKKSRNVFFQNEEDMAYFIDRGIVDPLNVILLPGSGIDTQKFAFKKKASSENPLHFLMISRLIADKGVREFVVAAALVKKQYPLIEFTLVGDDKVSNKTAITSKEINQWKRDGAVKLTGNQINIMDYIYTSDVLVLPSYREGMPRTVLEAASCGRPAIVSDVPGCRHSIVEDETGWLVPVKNSQSLADMMINLIEGDYQKISEAGQQARKHVEKNFCHSIVIDQYKEVLVAALDAN